MKYKRILVTGGAGFIGRHLVKHLLKDGYEVIVVDIIEPVIKDINYIQSDVSDQNIIGPLLNGVDVVFHLAALVGVDACRLDPERVMNENYLKAENFIKLCYKSGVKKIIFSSSSEVYGDSKIIPYRESAKPHPVSVYGKTKILTETFINEVVKQNKFQAGIVRMFNIYGSGQRKTFLISKFLDLAIHNKPLTIYGDGKQIRCFTYISDAVDGLIKFMHYDETPFEIVNIGRKQEYSINQVARMVFKCIPDSKSTIIYLPYGNGVREEKLEIRRRVPDVEKARRLFGFEARISLEQGINKMLHLPMPR